MAITVAVNEVDQYGVIVDRPSHTLPLNAWTRVRNIRFSDGSAQKFLGELEILGTPLFAPYWVMPVGTPTTFWWIYAGLNQVAATDGSAHFDITRSTGGQYNANLDQGWAGVVLGGVPIINNGVDVPQYWSAISGGQRLSDLPNWPENLTCSSLRAYLNFLIALDVTENGTRFPQLLRWSHPAEAGSVPSTWDISDTTKDAGRRMLGDSSDFILDGLALGNSFIVYKENSIWRLTFTAGQEIFDSRPVTEAVGMLAKGCAVEFQRGRHAVFGDSDFVVHDGQTVQSIADERVRRTVFDSINGDTFRRSFVLHLRNEKEVWFAYPEAGQLRPTKVAVWNFERNRWGFRDFPDGFFAAAGVVNSGSAADTWDGDTRSWDGDSGAWNSRLYNPLLKKPLVVSPNKNKFLLAETGSQWDGGSMEVVLEREALPLPISGKVDAPPDFTTWKQFLAVWPQIEGTTGGVVQVQVGVKASMTSDTVWQAPRDFVIGQSTQVDCLGAAGRLLCLRFMSSSPISWKLKSYEIELQPRGKF